MLSQHALEVAAKALVLIRRQRVAGARQARRPECLGAHFGELFDASEVVVIVALDRARSLSAREGVVHRG